MLTSIHFRYRYYFQGVPRLQTAFWNRTGQIHLHALSCRDSKAARSTWKNQEQVLQTDCRVTLWAWQDWKHPGRPDQGYLGWAESHVVWPTRGLGYVNWYQCSHDGSGLDRWIKKMVSARVHQYIRWVRRAFVKDKLGLAILRSFLPSSYRHEATSRRGWWCKLSFRRRLSTILQYCKQLEQDDYLQTWKDANPICRIQHSRRWTRELRWPQSNLWQGALR